MINRNEIEAKKQFVSTREKKKRKKKKKKKKNKEQFGSSHLGSSTLTFLHCEQFVFFVFSCVGTCGIHGTPLGADHSIPPAEVWPRVGRNVSAAHPKPSFAGHAQRVPQG